MVPKNKLTIYDLEWELDQLSQEDRASVEARMALASAQLKAAQEAYTNAFQTECDVLRAKRKGIL